MTCFFFLICIFGACSNVMDDIIPVVNVFIISPANYFMCVFFLRICYQEYKFSVANNITLAL
jgi:hypothetical protein